MQSNIRKDRNEILHQHQAIILLSLDCKRKASIARENPFIILTAGKLKSGTGSLYRRPDLRTVALGVKKSIQNVEQRRLSTYLPVFLIRIRP